MQQQEHFWNQAQLMQREEEQEGQDEKEVEQKRKERQGRLGAAPLACCP